MRPPRTIDPPATPAPRRLRALAEAALAHPAVARSGLTATEDGRWALQLWLRHDAPLPAEERDRLAGGFPVVVEAEPARRVVARPALPDWTGEAAGTSAPATGAGHRGRRRGTPPVGGLISLPIVGEIAAGVPIQPLDAEAEHIDVSAALAGGADAFVLRVRGESMVDEHILDGDLVIVRPQATARDGEIVVALLADNSVTLKSFYREGDHVRLQPANPAMAPILVRPGEEFAVQGTVRAVIRPVGAGQTAGAPPVPRAPRQRTRRTG